MDKIYEKGLGNDVVISAVKLWARETCLKYRKIYPNHNLDDIFIGGAILSYLFFEFQGLEFFKYTGDLKLNRIPRIVSKIHTNDWQLTCTIGKKNIDFYFTHYFDTVNNFKGNERVYIFIKDENYALINFLIKSNSIHTYFVKKFKRIDTDDFNLKVTTSSNCKVYDLIGPLQGPFGEETGKYGVIFKNLNWFSPEVTIASDTYTKLVDHNYSPNLKECVILQNKFIIYLSSIGKLSHINHIGFDGCAITFEFDSSPSPEPKKLTALADQIVEKYGLEQFITPKIYNQLTNRTWVCHQKV